MFTRLLYLVDFDSAAGWCERLSGCERTSDVRRVRDVKRRVPHSDAIRGNARALAASRVRHLLRCPLLDLYLRAARSAGVDRRRRGGHEEWHARSARHDGQHACADLVGGVAVGDDAVRADDDGVNTARGEQGRRGTVDDECRRHALRDQLERREAGALVIRPALGGKVVWRYVVASVAWAWKPFSLLWATQTAATQRTSCRTCQGAADQRRLRAW